MSSEENMRICVQSYGNKRYQYELLEMKIANADRLATWKRPVPAYRTSRPNRLLLITHDCRVTPPASSHQGTRGKTFFFPSTYESKQIRPIIRAAPHLRTQVRQQHAEIELQISSFA